MSSQQDDASAALERQAIAINEPPAIRTVAVQFPDGETQYWLTDQVFSPGDTVERNGRTWLVAHVAGSRETAKEPRVVLQDQLADGLPAGDVDERDRVAWNLPRSLHAP